MNRIQRGMWMGCLATFCLLGMTACKQKAEPESRLLEEAPVVSSGLPRLVCLGAGQCIPCKAMEPVREALKTEYAGRLQVEFHDVWKNPDVAEQYGVTTIPTTVFIDSTGQERHRQVGVMTAEEILAKWAEVGVTLSPADSPSSLEP